METATRLFELLALLQARPFWSCDELAERLGVTPRTVRRDVARLRGLGHPVEAVLGRHGGYQLGSGDELPPLVLDDREALAVVLGLRLAAAGSGAGIEETALGALAKLERVLPERLRERLRDVAAATVMLGAGPLVATDPDHLILFAEACRRRVRVRFPYESRDGSSSYRHVEPLRLVHVGRRWYLVAYDLDRDDWRTFRVDRARLPVLTGVRCEQRDEPDAEALVREGLAVRTYQVQVTVRLHVGHEEASACMSPWWGVLEPDGDTTILRMGGDDLVEVARWLGVLQWPFEILDPPELRVALHHHARTLLDA